MLVVIAVRDAHAGLVKLAGPVQLLQMALAFDFGYIGFRSEHVLQEALGRARDSTGLICIRAKALGQPVHHGRSDILGAFAIDQIVECAVAQSPLRGMHFIDLQQIKHRLQNRQSAANHRLALFLDAFQAQVIYFLSFDETLFEPRHPVSCDTPLGPAGLGQNLRNRTHGS